MAALVLVFKKAFGGLVIIINDTVMQTLNSTTGTLFIGVGTDLGSATIVDGVLELIELAARDASRKMTYG